MRRFSRFAALCHPLCLGTLVRRVAPRLNRVVTSALCLTLTASIFSSAVFASVGFVAGRTLDAGPNPGAIAVADFNGDGKPDVIIANNGAFGPSGQVNGHVNVLLNQGSGSFVSVQSAVPNLVLWGMVAVADFNQDGKLDIAVSGINSSSNSEQVAILLGNGDGTFQAPSSQEIVAAGDYPVSIAIGDFDGDGLPDIAVALVNDSTLQIIKNTGSGNFQNGGSVPTCSNPRSIAVADLNGDGKQDIAVACQAGTVAAMLGDGAFHFQDKFSGFAKSPVSIAIADVNGDGKLDLVTANDGGVTVLLGNGDGSYSGAKAYAPFSSPFSVVVADINGDRKPDLIEFTDDPSDIGVLTNNGDGTFSTPTFFSAGGPTFNSPDRALVVSDFDEDGKPDIVALNPGDTVTLLSGKGDGSFPSPRTVPTGSGTASVASADFNGDGNADFVTANSGTNSVNVYLGDSQGGFSPGASYSVGVDPVFVATADLNGDGKPDIIAVSQGDANNAGSIAILLGNGDGTFTAKTPLTPGQDPQAVTIGDFNSDGKMDLAVVDQGDTMNPSVVEVYFGNNDGTFASSFSIPVGSNPRGIASARLTKNGSLDLVVYNVRGCSLTILQNQGNGTSFVNVNTLFVGQCAFFGPIAIDDLNGDGLPEIIVDSSYDHIQVFRNNDNYQFSSAVFPAHFAPVAIATGDFDGDGHKDVASVNGNGNTTLSLLRGLGDGTLAPPINFAVGTNANSLAIADVNHDGLPDLLVASSGLDAIPASVSVLLNGFGLTASLSASANPTQFMQPLQLTASFAPIVSQVASPSGSIAFSEGTALLATAQADQNGGASITSPTLAVGVHTFTAKYSGLDFLTKTADLAVTVNKANTSVALSGATSGLTGQALTFAARVAGQFGGTPSGNVDLLDGSTPVATEMLDSTSQAQFSISTLTAGPHSLGVTYAGDPSFLASNAQPLDIDLQNPTTVSLVPSAASASFGSAVAFSVAVSSATAVPTGQVLFQLGSTTLGQVSLDGSGKASFSTSSLSGGVHDIVASYVGNSFFEPNSSTTTVTVAPIASSIALSSSAQSMGGGSNVTFTAKLAPQFGTTPTGTVAFSVGSTNLGSTAVDNTGAAVFSTSSLPIGNDAITAAYSGDVNFIGLTSAAVNVNVTPDFQISPSATSQSVHPGQSASFTLNLTPFGSFATPITFACSGLPALAACSFSPSSVTFTNSSSVAVAVTISTAGSSASLRQVEHPRIGGYFIYAIGGFGIIGLVLAGGTRRRSTKIIAFCVLLVVVAGTIACGGGSGSSGGGTPPPPVPTTPLGTSTVIVTASETQNGNTISHQTQFMLTVD